VENYFSGGFNIYKGKEPLEKGEDKAMKPDTALAGKKFFKPALIEVWCLNP